MTRTITFYDIQKGDTVRTTRVFDGGFTLTLEGKAERLTSGPIGGRGWYTDNTHCVASESFGMKAKDTIELIHRNEPKEWIVVGYRDGVLDHNVASFDIMTESKAEETAAEYTKIYARSDRYCQFYKAIKIQIPA